MLLVKGQRVKLASLTSSTTFQINVSISGSKERIGFYCLALDAQHKLIDQRYLVYVGNKQSSCNSISIQELTASTVAYTLNLATLPGNARELIVAASFGESTGSLQENASDITSGSLALSVDGKELARFSFSGQDFTGEKTIILGRLYLKDEWRLAIDGSGFRDRVTAFFQHYGASAPQVAEPPPRTEAPIPPQQQPGQMPTLQIAKLLLPSDWPGNRVPEIPRDLIHAVGLLMVEDREGNKATGTGFVISPGGLLLSCYHVIANFAQIYICMENTEIVRPVVFLAGDETLDIALLWIADGNGSSHWMLLAPPDDKPALGDPLGLLAYPLGFDLGLSVTYSQGIINSTRQRGNVPLLQIDAGAAPGSSGGPVFRRSDGRIVGMLQSGITGEGRGIIINLALDLRVFWSLGWV